MLIAVTHAWLFWVRNLRKSLVPCMTNLPHPQLMSFPYSATMRTWTSFGDRILTIHYGQPLLRDLHLYFVAADWWPGDNIFNVEEEEWRWGWQSPHEWVLSLDPCPRSRGKCFLSKVMDTFKPVMSHDWGNFYSLILPHGLKSPY